MRPVMLPYDNFPITLRLPIKRKGTGYMAGVEHLYYEAEYGHFLISIPENIRTIIGYLKGQEIGYPFPQALHFEKKDSWTMPKAIKWLEKRFLIKPFKEE